MSKQFLRNTLAFTLGVLTAIILGVLFTSDVEAADFSEADYQKFWCANKNGQIEYTLDDGARGSRVDCLTDDYAIEFDFLKKWPEALSQAQYYAKMTGKIPGIVLIIEDRHYEYNYVYILRLLNTVTETESHIRFWFIYADDLPKREE